MNTHYTTQTLADRAEQLIIDEGLNARACYQAAREAGVPAESLHATVDLVMTELTNRRIRRVFIQTNPLRLRPQDRVEGDEVVLTFKGRRTLRMPLSEWRELCRKPEPHALAALTLTR
jgi:hypothetical protein